MNERLRLALLFLPVLLQLCVFRLTEYSLVRSGAWTADFDDIFLGIVAANLPGFLLALLCPIGLYALIRLAAPGTHPALAALPGLAATLLLLGVLPADRFLSPWLESRAIEFIFLDNLFVLGTGLLLFLLLERSKRTTRRVFLVLAHVVAAFASLLLSLNFGYFLKTGTSGDWLLFWYALNTIHETRDVIASEINWVEIGLLTLPVIIALGPILLSRIESVRLWRPDLQPEARPFFWMVVGCTLLVLGSQMVLDSGVSRTRGSLFAGFVREAASVREAPPNVLSRDEWAFDADRLRLIPVQNPQKLNVVFVVLESVRADALTPYTPELPTTPFLDSLAASGVLVEQMYAPVAHTTKAMVPLFAGVYPSLQLHFPEARRGGLPARALPDLLAPLGYRSAFFTPAPLEFENKEGLLRNMGFQVLRGGGSFDPEGFDRIGYFGYEDAVVLEPAMEWVDEVVASDDPFLLSILTLTAHHPYTPPRRFAHGRYDSHLPDGYLNTIASTDAFLRDLYYAFRDRGLLDETLFIIVADHGEAFREHGMTGHNQVLWDEVLHVPCILHGPALANAPRRIQGARSQVDLVPTITDLLGFSIVDGRIPGRSLLEDVDDRVIFHSAWNSRQGLALRDATTKYVYTFRRERMKAFHYVTDVREREDMGSTLPDDLVREIEQELRNWRWAVQSAY